MRHRGMQERGVKAGADASDWQHGGKEASLRFGGGEEGLGGSREG